MTTTTTALKPPSEKSLDFLRVLVRDRDVSPGRTAPECLADLDSWLSVPRAQREVSAMIDRNKAKPRRTVFVALPTSSGATSYVPYPSAPDVVPSSKFAVLTELLTQLPLGWRGQELVFFEVKQKYGKNYRIVRRLTGAPGEFKRTTLPAALASELYGLLENQAFAYQAALAFGMHYTVCGRCGAELSDDDSRKRHMGPICWGLMAPYRAAAEAAAA